MFDPWTPIAMSAPRRTASQRRSSASPGACERRSVTPSGSAVSPTPTAVKAAPGNAPPTSSTQPFHVAPLVAAPGPVVAQAQDDRRVAGALGLDTATSASRSYVDGWGCG